MRYSIVLASLAASAMATSYINIIEIGNEQPEIVEVVPRGQILNGNCRQKEEYLRELRREERREDRDGDRFGRRRNERRFRDEREEDLERDWFGRMSHRRNDRYESRYGQCDRRGGERRDYDRRYDVLAVMASWTPSSVAGTSTTGNPDSNVSLRLEPSVRRRKPLDDAADRLVADSMTSRPE